MRGHAHDDDVGGVGGLGEVGGGAQGVAQDDVVAEVAAVAVVVVDVLGGLLRAHPLQRRPAARADGRHGGAPGTATEDNDFGFALLSCHGDQRIADTGDLEAVHRRRRVPRRVETNDLAAGDFGPYPVRRRCRDRKGWIYIEEESWRDEQLPPKRRHGPRVGSDVRDAVRGRLALLVGSPGHRRRRRRSSAGQPGGKGGGDDPAGCHVPRRPRPMAWSGCPTATRCHCSARARTSPSSQPGPAPVSSSIPTAGWRPQATASIRTRRSS